MAQRNNQPNNRHDLKVDFGKISIENGLIKIPAIVRVLLKNVPVVGTQVMFQEGINLPPSNAIATTNNMGFAVYTYEFPDSRAKEVVKLKISLLSFGDEAVFDFTLPEITNKNAKKQKSDPDDLFVFAYTNNATGQACIDVRVTDELGNGIPDKTVQFFIQDGACLFPPQAQNSSLPPSTSLPYHEVKTDSEGSVIFLFPRNLRRGEEIEVRAKVSGIEEICEVVISRDASCRRNRSRLDRILSHRYLRWLGLHNNNLRAQKGWILSVLWFIFCLYAGFGSMSVTGEHWPQYSWIFWFLYTVIVLPLYTIAALREELRDLWIYSVRRIRRRHKDSAHDPMFERLLEMVGQVSSTRARSHAALQTNGPVIVNEEKSSKIGFGTMFASDVFAEFVWDFLSKAAVRIFRGR